MRPTQRYSTNSVLRIYQEIKDAHEKCTVFYIRLIAPNKIQTQLIDV